jgi:mannose-6-phosphate isomerase-like protein (cupin superfamily)
MRYVLVLTAFLATAVLLGAAAETPKVTFADHDKVAKGGSIVATPDYTVSMNSRTGAGQVEVHEKETDIFYVTDGEATLVTGGKMIGGKTTAPNQLRGTSIDGGESRHLVKGDVVVVPAGIPHWFKEVPKSVQYFTVKSIR